MSSHSIASRQASPRIQKQIWPNSEIKKDWPGTISLFSKLDRDFDDGERKLLRHSFFRYVFCAHKEVTNFNQQEKIKAAEHFYKRVILIHEKQETKEQKLMVIELAIKILESAQVSANSGECQFTIAELTKLEIEYANEIFSSHTLSHTLDMEDLIGIICYQNHRLLPNSVLRKSSLTNTCKNLIHKIKELS